MSMARLFQYKAHTEPVSQDAETITVDKWEGSAVVPVRRKRGAAEGWFTTSLEISLTTPATLDWYEEPSRPRNPIKPRREGGNAFVSEPSVTTPIAIDWFREAERPRNPARRLVPEGWYVRSPEEPSETEREHGWQVEQPGPTYRRPRRQETPPPFSPEPTTLTIVPMGWEVPGVQVRRPKPRPSQPFATTQEPSGFAPQSLDWYAEPNRPRNPVKPRQHQPFTPSHDEPVPPIDWFPPSPMPVRRRPQVRAGLYVAQVVIDLLDMAWMHEGDRPRMTVRPRTAAYPVSPFLDLTEPPAGWLVPCDVRQLLSRPGASPFIMPADSAGPILPPGLVPDDRDAVGDEEGDADLAGG